MRPRLFASLLFPVQHQHDVHEPEAFSVWRLQLGQDFVMKLVATSLQALQVYPILQVLKAVCLLWHLETNFYALYSRYCLAWVPLWDGGHG